jgi:hypothetical protein
VTKVSSFDFTASVGKIRNGYNNGERGNKKLFFVILFIDK